MYYDSLSLRAYTCTTKRRVKSYLTFDEISIVITVLIEEEYKRELQHSSINNKEIKNNFIFSKLIFKLTVQDINNGHQVKGTNAVAAKIDVLDLSSSSSARFSVYMQ